MSEKTPIWKFDSVKLFYLRPSLKDSVKSTDRCHASINFGFFVVTDIGLSRERDGTITWSHDFGWSQFKFNPSQIDNPYCGEVTKLMRMIKEELDRKRSVIIDFLDDPSTMPKVVKD